MNTLEAGWRQNALLTVRDTLIAALNGRAILHPGPELTPKDVPRLLPRLYA